MCLVSNPSVLFLDEPTSGLDSFIAFSVMRVLKRLCERGVTVVSTIHQPSSDTFTLFDDLLLLSEGHVCYHGPAAKAVGYFGKQGYKCPAHSNPADYFFMVRSALHT